MHYPSHIDIGVYVGTIGLFFVFFLLFARYFPVLPIAEIKSILKSSGESYKDSPNTHQDKVKSASVIQKVKKVKAILTRDDISAKTATLISKLGTVSEGEKDNLKLISGVGPVLEGKLNKIGIYTYLQVSKITTEEYRLLDELTGSSKGRSERDDWVGQVKKLMNKSNN
jgi:molybdopterin-containing oxidoreductase family membrane subunit